MRLMTTLLDNKAGKTVGKALADHITLKPTTIPIPAYTDAEREYPEMAVIQVDLKRAGRVQRLAEIVHRTIPYPLIVAFASEDGVAVSLAHKRFSRSEADAVVAEGFQTTGWFDPDRVEAPTADFLASLDVGGWPHTNFLAFYEAAMARVVALGCAGVTGRFEIGSPESAEARRERLARCHELENRIRDLRGKIRKETQFNRQLDLNMEIQQLEREREGLKSEL